MLTIDGTLIIVPVIKKKIYIYRYIAYLYLRASKRKCFLKPCGSRQSLWSYYLPSIVSMSMVLMAFPWILSTSLSWFSFRWRTLKAWREIQHSTCTSHGHVTHRIFVSLLENIGAFLWHIFTFSSTLRASVSKDRPDQPVLLSESPTYLISCLHLLEKHQIRVRVDQPRRPTHHLQNRNKLRGRAMKSNPKLYFK